MSDHSREMAASRSCAPMACNAPRSACVKTSESHSSLEGMTALSISMPMGPTVETATTEAQRVWEQLKFNASIPADSFGFPRSERSKLHSCGGVCPPTASDNAFLRTLRVASERWRFSKLRIDANSRASSFVSVPQSSANVAFGECGMYQIRTPGEISPLRRPATGISTSGPRAGGAWVDFLKEGSRSAIFKINADKTQSPLHRSAAICSKKISSLRKW